MHTGNHYSLWEFIMYTRRDLYWMVLLAVVPTVLFELAGCRWMAMPWVPVAMIGTAAAFIIGFKNNATYGRLWEARQIYGAIVNSSRTWGIMVKDFIAAPAGSTLTAADLKRFHQQLIYRHCAWLTALRFQLREPRSWENTNTSYNREYRRLVFKIPEQGAVLATELEQYLEPAELEKLLTKKNRATQLIASQSAVLRQLHDSGLLDNFRHVEMENLLKELYEHQGKAERIKNFPYPRQFASINLFFIRLFIIMVPFGLLNEFAKMGEHFVWLNIPFSVLVSWVFNAMEKVGEATENPFEGNANDVPITALSRTIEIDLRDMLDEADLPPALTPVNKILM